jgi:hypothetical protein
MERVRVLALLRVFVHDRDRELREVAPACVAGMGGKDLVSVRVASRRDGGERGRGGREDEKTD